MAKKASLNQRQWLNIIIFASAIMILIFTIAGKIIEQKTTPINDRPTNPFTHVNAIQIGNWLVEKKGSLWQQSRPLLEKEELQRWLHYWQTFSTTARQSASNREPHLEIIITDKQQSVHWFLVLDELPLLQPANSATAYILTQQQYNQLFPLGLLQHWPQKESL